MPFLAPFAPALIGAGASIAGSVFGSGKKTTTSTPTLPAYLQNAESGNLSTLQGITSNPSAGLQPIQQAAQDSINRGYAKLPQIATSRLASRGFGASGKVGDAVYDTEGARLGDLSQLHGTIAQLASQRQLSAAQIIQQMIQSGRGVSTTQPGNSLGNGLTTAGNALTNLTVLQTLQHMINGGGGVSGGGSGIEGPTITTNSPGISGEWQQGDDTGYGG